MLQELYDDNDSFFKRKPLKEIRKAYNLSAQHIADVAGVPLRTEYLIEIGATVSKEDALRIVWALSALTGAWYTIDNVLLYIRDDEES